MKSLLAAGMLFAVVTSLHGQTTNTAPATPATAPTKTAAIAPAADAGAAGSTNRTANSAEPYPVTAVVVSNTITFPILLSKNSEPLMTNALYRRTFGRKVIFAADLSVKSFDIDKLHPSVIAQLDLDPNKVKADQETLDKQNQAWAAQYQQQNQQLIAAEAAAMKKNAEAAQAAQAAATNGAPPGSQPRHSKHAKTGNNQNPPPPPAN